jgi:hypothetical protein
MRKIQRVRALIPPSAVVRVELARSARERDRLRELLKLAVRFEEDRNFVRSLAADRPAEGPHEAAAQGVAR